MLWWLLSSGNLVVMGKNYNFFFRWILLHVTGNIGSLEFQIFEAKTFHRKIGNVRDAADTKFENSLKFCFISSQYAKQ